MTPDTPTDPLPDAASAAPRPTRTRVAFLGGAAAALALVGGGIGVAAMSGATDANRPTVAAAAAAQAEDDGSAPATCEPGGGMRRGAGGTISAIDGSTLTLEGREGEAVTVTTTDETTVRDAAEGAVPDIAEGDHVVVMGAEADGAVTAVRVVDLGELDPEADRPEGAPAPPEGEAPTPPEGAPDGGRPGRPTAGTVASVDGATFTVTTAEDETVTVTTTDETEVTVVTEIAVSDLAVGDEIRVGGEVTDGTVAADRITRGDLPLAGGRHHGPGGPGGRPGAGDGEQGTGAGGEGETPPTTTEG